MARKKKRKKLPAPVGKPPLMTPTEKQKLGLALLVVPLFVVIMGFATGGLAAIPEREGYRLAVRDIEGNTRCSIFLSARQLPGVVVYGERGERSWGFPGVERARPATVGSQP
ncbi:MAG: hypothetical protein HY319_24815 [Armatimonadetes bacterium]|nr:hypothetical protein [Armatimonadota bacterium]